MNTDKQRDDEANKIAQNEGYDYAKFVGVNNGDRIYLADTQEQRDLGLPLWIIATPDDQFWTARGFQYSNMIKE